MKINTLVIGEPKSPEIESLFFGPFRQTVQSEMFLKYDGSLFF